MTENDNSVNIAPAHGRDAYHHGDLRSALIEAGMHALSTHSADALSLRALAREVGVSATAVYRHFPDRDALLVALALTGFDQLAAAQQAASRAASGKVRWQHFPQAVLPMCVLPSSIRSCSG